MLPTGITYPLKWALMYIGKDLKMYECIIEQIHFDDIEVYYTIDVLTGPFIGERQTVNQRLYSFVDVLNEDEIKRIFAKYIHTQE
jgi:hypothetical protein